MMQDGRTFKSVSYDARSNVELRSHYTVKKVTEINGDYQSAVKAVFEAPNEKSVSLNFVMRCANSNYYLDMSTYLSQLQLTDSDGMDITVQGDFLEMPATISTGDRLKEGKVILEASMEGIPAMSLVYKVTNRKVLSRETISTNAGDFDCYKIVSEFESDMGLMNVRGTIIEWWSTDMLIVRTEYYNSFGKLTSTTLLESSN